MKFLKVVWICLVSIHIGVSMCGYDITQFYIAIHGFRYVVYGIFLLSCSAIAGDI